MHMGSKNIEWILVAGLVIVVVIEFLLLSGGVAANTIQTTMIQVLLLMVFAAQAITAIILLRIYDTLAMTKKGKKG